MTISHQLSSIARTAALALVGATISVASSASTLSAQTPDFDRTKPPVVPPPKPLAFPKAQVRQLSNGVPVIVLEDHHSPVVAVQAMFDIGALAEPSGKKGLYNMTQGMMDEGSTTHTADQLADIFADLGNSVSPQGFYTITQNVDKSLALMAEQLLSPAFPQVALDRAKANAAAGLKAAKESPDYLSRIAFIKVLYGEQHPYARVETEQEIMSITRDDVLAFYRDYFCPPNVKFIVAGDITPAEAVAKLNPLFGKLAKGKNGHPPVPAPAGVAATTIYLYDRPESPQSVITVGAIGPRRDSPDRLAIQTMNVTLGGAFTSRINLNLREQHQYTYGAQSGFSFNRPPEPSIFRAGTSVSTPKTDSALIELMKEIRDIRSTRPVTEGELAFSKNSQTAGMPLQFETIGQRAMAMMFLVMDDERLDYYNTLIPQINALTLTQDREAAAKYIDPNKMAIVVVGDRKLIEPGLRAANLAPIVILKPL